MYRLTSSSQSLVVNLVTLEPSKRQLLCNNKLFKSIFKPENNEVRNEGSNLIDGSQEREREERQGYLEPDSMTNCMTQTILVKYIVTQTQGYVNVSVLQTRSKKERDSVTGIKTAQLLLLLKQNILT